jgi:O-antigen ligase
MEQALVLGIIAAGGALSIASLTWGLALYALALPVLTFRDVSLASLGPASGVLTLVVLGALVVRTLVRGGAVRVSPLTPTLLGFAFASAVGLAVAGTDPVVTLMPFYYLALQQLVYSESVRLGDARRLLIVVAVGAVTIASLALSARIVGWPDWGQAGLQLTSAGLPVRLQGPADNPNQLANLLVIGVPLAFGLMLVARRRSAKAAWGIGLMLSLTALVLTSSRSAIFAVLATVVLFVLGSDKRSARKIMRIALGIGLVLLVFVPLLVGQYFSSRVWTLSDDGRLRQLSAVVRIVTQHPLFGVGPGQFAAAVSLEDPDALENPHNNIALVLVEGGIITCAFFVAVVWKAITTLLRGARRATGERRIFLTAVTAAFGAYFVHGMFHVNYRWSWLWFFLGISMALASAVQPRSTCVPCVADTEEGTP